MINSFVEFLNKTISDTSKDVSEMNTHLSSLKINLELIKVTSKALTKQVDDLVNKAANTKSKNLTPQEVIKNITILLAQTLTFKMCQGSVHYVNFKTSKFDKIIKEGFVDISEYRKFAREVQDFLDQGNEFSEKISLAIKQDDAILNNFVGNKQ